LNDVAAIGAYEIGNVGNDPNSILAEGSVGYDLAHAALGCAISAAGGTGCAGGAIGGAASAMFSPDFIKAIDPTGAALDSGQLAALAGFATLLGGGLGALVGGNADGAATAAQNEAVNNSGADSHIANTVANGGWIGNLVTGLSSMVPWLPTNPIAQGLSGSLNWLASGVTFNSSDSDTKTPNTGEPGSWHINPGSGQERQYGLDGYPEVDIDSDHDHGQGNPHAHNWEPNPKGGFPARGPGVPVSPWNPGMAAP
jgi:hypothetical protein